MQLLQQQSKTKKCNFLLWISVDFQIIYHFVTPSWYKIFWHITFLCWWTFRFDPPFQPQCKCVVTLCICIAFLSEPLGEFCDLSVSLGCYNHNNVRSDYFALYCGLPHPLHTCLWHHRSRDYCSVPQRQNGQQNQTKGE